MSKFWDFWKEGTKASMMRIMFMLAGLTCFANVIIRSLNRTEIDWMGMGLFIGLFIGGKVVQKIFGETKVV